MYKYIDIMSSNVDQLTVNDNYVNQQVSVTQQRLTIDQWPTYWLLLGRYVRLASTDIVSDGQLTIS